MLAITAIALASFQMLVDVDIQRVISADDMADGAKHIVENMFSAK